MRYRMVRRPFRPARLVVAGALLVAALCVLAPSTAAARSHGHGGEDRVAIFGTIDVRENEQAGDIACMFCTINIEGDVNGDVAAMFATVNAGSGRTISGDVATLFSSLRVGRDTHIHGDLATAMSSVHLASGVVVDGEKAFLSSGFGLMVVVAPLLLLAGVVWLLVWLVRRLLYPTYRY